MTGIIGLHTAQRVARARANPGPHLCLRPFSRFCLTPFWSASSILALRQFRLLLLFFASLVCFLYFFFLSCTCTFCIFGAPLFFVSYGLLLFCQFWSTSSVLCQFWSTSSVLYQRSSTDVLRQFWSTSVLRQVWSNSSVSDSFGLLLLFVSFESTSVLCQFWPTSFVFR